MVGAFVCTSPSLTVPMLRPLESSWVIVSLLATPTTAAAGIGHTVIGIVITAVATMTETVILTDGIAGTGAIVGALHLLVLVVGATLLSTGGAAASPGAPLEAAALAAAVTMMRQTGTPLDGKVVPSSCSFNAFVPRLVRWMDKVCCRLIKAKVKIL